MMDHGLRGGAATIRIKVTDISSMRIEMLDLCSGDTVGILKRRIEARGMGLAVDQRLAFAGRVLANDEHTLVEAGVEGMCAIILSLRRYSCRTPPPSPTLLPSFCLERLFIQTAGMWDESHEAAPPPSRIYLFPASLDSLWLGGGKSHPPPPENLRVCCRREVVGTEGAMPLAPGAERVAEATPLVYTPPHPEPPVRLQHQITRSRLAHEITHQLRSLTKQASSSLPLLLTEPGTTPSIKRPG